jgi:hypothetical protein
MKYLLYTLLITLSLSPASLFAQRKCGAQQLKAAIIRQHPEAAALFDDQRNTLQSIVDNYKRPPAARSGQRTTTAGTIPVIFHIIADSAQLARMGGIAGLNMRVDSQIAVLNRDFNRQNRDSTAIPTGWKPLYGNAGIHFGLAHTAPGGGGSLGYDLKIVSAPGGFSQGSSGNYDAAKHSGAGGLDAWDVTKYINVWCVNFTDDPGLLGITVAKSLVTAGFVPASEEGICINFLALGCQTNPASLTFPTGGGGSVYDLGRTLTHEMGHFFEIWHTWGDDEFMAGQCPWTGGKDDGIADTPPQAVATTHNPVYTIAGGTINDGCMDSALVNMQPIGIACLDYMDYTDDIGMHLFTNDQAAVMASQVTPTGENYSLTQDPALLNWSPYTEVKETAENNALTIFPNPAADHINIAVGATSKTLQRIGISDIFGREVYSINTHNNNIDFYSIDLSGMNKGIYFVRCTFASGSTTRKILLQ